MSLCAAASDEITFHDCRQHFATIQNSRWWTQKMNVERTVVVEKTEELHSKALPTLVEASGLFCAYGNGDIVFANEQAARLTGHACDPLHKIVRTFVDPVQARVLSDIAQARPSCMVSSATDGAVVPADLSAGAHLSGKHCQSVVRHVLPRTPQLLEEKEIEALKSQRGLS
jgi:hypothetical protein